MCPYAFMLHDGAWCLQPWHACCHAKAAAACCLFQPCDMLWSLLWWPWWKLIIAGPGQLRDNYASLLLLRHRKSQVACLSSCEGLTVVAMVMSCPSPVQASRETSVPGARVMPALSSMRTALASSMTSTRLPAAITAQPNTRLALRRRQQCVEQMTDAGRRCHACAVLSAHRTGQLHDLHTTARSNHCRHIESLSSHPPDRKIGISRWGIRSCPHSSQCAPHQPAS